MSRRTGVLLIIVVLIIVLIGAGGLMLMGGALAPDAGPSPEQQTLAAATPVPTEPPGSPIVIVRADGEGIRRGREIQGEDLDIVFWPNQYLPSDPLSDIEQVVGQISRTDILPGQPVLDYMLFDREDPDTGVAQVGSNAALVIPQNYVAIAFPLTRLSSVAYGIRPGDHVDALMSFRFVDLEPDYQTSLPNEAAIVVEDPETGAVTLNNIGMWGRVEDTELGSLLIVPSEEQRPRQTTQVVVFDAIVLRVGEFPSEDERGAIVVVEPDVVVEQPAEGEAPPPTPTPVPQIIPDIVTLMMPRQDALVLKYAMETGAYIDLVLRSVYDNGVDFRGTTEPVTLEYLVRNYNVPVPDTLGYAQQPRIDDYVQEGDFFVPRDGGSQERPPDY